jgi:hypothetical protein
MSKIKSFLARDISVSFLDEDYISLQIQYDDIKRPIEEVVLPVELVKSLIHAVRQSAKDAKRHRKSKRIVEALNFDVIMRPDGRLSIDLSSEVSPSETDHKIIMTPQLADEMCKAIYNVLSVQSNG